MEKYIMWKWGAWDYTLQNFPIIHGGGWSNQLHKKLKEFLLFE